MNIKGYWADHGTKILGTAVILWGAAGESLVYIQQLDPKHAAIWGVVITLGGAVLRRGFVNSQRNDP